MNRSSRRAVAAALAVTGLTIVLFLVRGPLLMTAPACFAGRWHGCYDTFNGPLLMMLVGLPVPLSVAWALARLRQAAANPAAAVGGSRVGVGGPGVGVGGPGAGGGGSPTGRAAAWRKSVAEVGLVYGTVPMVWLTLQPGPGAGVVPGRVSLVPLRDLATMGPIGIGGNLLVLAAMGFFAPIRFAALASLPRVLALGAGCSALIETAQYVFRLDRVSSIDDVLVNAAGAGLAALASRPWWAYRERSGATSSVDAGSTPAGGISGRVGAG
jgi:hypothetical protein